MGRSRTSFKPGNKAAVGRGKATAQLIADAFDAAALNLVNNDRKIAWTRVKRLFGEEMANDLFAPTTDPVTARIHMIEMLGRMAKTDKTANKLFWDRYMPKPKMGTVVLDPEIKNMPPDQAAAHVAALVANGDISPDVGDALIRVFSGAAQIREMEANTRLMHAMADEEEGFKE